MICRKRSKEIAPLLLETFLKGERENPNINKDQRLSRQKNRGKMENKTRLKIEQNVNKQKDDLVRRQSYLFVWR